MSERVNRPISQFEILSSARPTHTELTRDLPGDGLVPEASIVINSAITLRAAPHEVWPWLTQIGRSDEGRGGWPLPRRVERFFPANNRALRSIADPSDIKPLEEGDKIRDWFTWNLHEDEDPAMLTVHTANRPNTLVFTSERAKGRVALSWTLVLETQDEATTRLHSRTQISGIRWIRLYSYLGTVSDRVLAVGLRAGLNERLESRT